MCMCEDFWCMTLFLQLRDLYQKLMDHVLVLVKKYEA